MAPTLTMADLVEAAGGRFGKKAGSRLIYRNCPICGGKDAFYIDPESNTYCDFHCGSAGGMMDFQSRMVDGIPYAVNPDRRAVGKRFFSRFAPGLNPAGNLARSSGRETKTPRRGDRDLGCVYGALMTSEALRLTEKDRCALTRRGLSRSDIQENGYCSFRTEAILGHVPGAFRASIGDGVSDEVLCAAWLGHGLSEKGFRLDGIPGAYLLDTARGQVPAFHYHEGIGIPIRSRSGRIVAVQVRTAFRKAKYLMISSGGLPGGTCGKNRVHHPLHAGTGDAAALIEGALKADVYTALSGTRQRVYGIVGVNSTADLYCEMESDHITRAFEYFDMDKLLNINVMNAARKLKENCRKKGIPAVSMLWDPAGAERKWKEMTEFAGSRGIVLEKGGTVYGCLARGTVTLYEAGESFSSRWYGRTKGIDDYLLSGKQ